MKNILFGLLLFTFSAHATFLPEDDSIVAGFGHIPVVYDATMQAVVNPDTGELLCAADCQTFTGKVEQPKEEPADPIDLSLDDLSLIVYDGKRTIVYDGQAKLTGNSKNIEVVMTTLIKYTQPRCPKVTKENAKITVYIAIGERVEAYTGALVKMEFGKMGLYSDTIFKE